MTPKRVISNPDSSSVSVRPSRSKSRSNRCRRVGSANALNTRSSAMRTTIGDHLVTCQAPCGSVAPEVAVDDGPGPTGRAEVLVDELVAAGLVTEDHRD